MLVEGKKYQTIWINPIKKNVVNIIDQCKLPFSFEIVDLTTPEDAFVAIKDMLVRGAPLIGATGAMGIYLASLQLSNSDKIMNNLRAVASKLKSARPTAVNLAIVIDSIMNSISSSLSVDEVRELTYKMALECLENEINYCKQIGDFGVRLIEEISKRKKGATVNILTHCNAGWLACIDYGTALAPVYQAQERGIPVHVWVDETRPRNQGSRLTAWELQNQGIPHTVIADNTGGHLMQHKMVDIVIVGSDRTTRTGDVANKIGTYLKALAAFDNNIPFYVALPSSSFDFSLRDGINQIPIEQRSAREITHVEGNSNGKIVEVNIIPDNSKVANYGFDVTPSRLISGLITERGICEANEQSITKVFSDLLSMTDEGYIKFNCNRNNNTISIKRLLFNELNKWRKRLYDLSLIGAYNNGIGYGNISVRNAESSFFITGSSTGTKQVLSMSDYALVNEWDYENNRLECTGKTNASSESLSHAAVYDAIVDAAAVIHIHSEKMWKLFHGKLPTTSNKILFGTPEMAIEIKRLLKKDSIREQGIIIMGGHKDGIITFGESLDQAGEIVLKYYNQSLKTSVISFSGDK